MYKPTLAERFRFRIRLRKSFNRKKLLNRVYAYLKKVRTRYVYL